MISLLWAAVLAGAAPSASVQRTVAAMGTELTVAVFAPRREAALRASEAAINAVAAVEERLSTWRTDSELSRLNAAAAGTPVLLSPATAAELGRARELWQATEGAFDPGIGSLVAAWDLRGPGMHPSTAELARARASSGLHLLELTGAQAVRTVTGLRLEEGAFGKGVGLDAAAGAALGAGATCAVLDLGGQLRVAGRCPVVTVAVAHPDHREREQIALRITGGSLATSGNAERGRVVDGVSGGHLLDPRTGHPAVDFGSATVWAPDGVTADALATALFVMGPQAAVAWVEGRPGVEALFLVRTPGALRIAATTGMWDALATTAGGAPLGTSDGSRRVAVQH